MLIQSMLSPDEYTTRWKYSDSRFKCALTLTLKRGRLYGENYTQQQTTISTPSFAEHRELETGMSVILGFDHFECFILRLMALRCVWNGL